MTDNAFDIMFDSLEVEPKPVEEEKPIDYKTLSSLKEGDEIYLIGNHIRDWGVGTVTEVVRLKSGTLRVMFSIGKLKDIRLLLSDGKMFNGNTRHHETEFSCYYYVTADINVWKRELLKSIRACDEKLHKLIDILSGFNEDYEIGSYNKIQEDK